MRKHIFLLAAAMTLASCGAPRQERAEKAVLGVPVPESGGPNDFRERRSIIQADLLRNRADVLFFAYHLADDGQLIDQWTCLGSPVSSTESVEPNTSYPVSGGTTYEYGWTQQIEGQSARSPEVMGIDGTYGDPAPFFFCITPAGGYEQWSIYDKVRVTTSPRVYPNRLVKVDTSQVAKIETARQILRGGGCIDDELNKIDCASVRKNIEGVQNK